MSLATYQQLAYAAIAETIGRGHLPILVGGTPLYINAVVEGWRVPQVAPDWPFRQGLEAEAAELGSESLLSRLRSVDPVAADRCGKNVRRIIRALEILEATGKPMSEVEAKGPRPYETLECWLTMPRDQLHQVIDKRVDDQIANGLIEEVRKLLESGLDPAAPSMSSLGYRQLVPYIAGVQTLPEAVHQIKVDTHRYVRHQETWLRRNPRLQKFDVTEPGWIENVAADVASFSGRVDVKVTSTRISNRDSAAER
jgi:tRNA dimethylallyltransferase